MSNLIDDGSGRLRDRRATDDHPKPCGCAYCRTMCCVPCHAINASNVKTWQSVQGFSRHVQSAHPNLFEFTNATNKLRRTKRAVRAHAMMQEEKRFARQGLRRIPIRKFNEESLKQISDWVASVERDPASNLLLGAISLADERFASRGSYESIVRRLTSDVEEGLQTGAFVTSERRTQFDPRIAIEVLKLCWTLGRGWSFIVHLLLLYGLDAFAKNLINEGISPPTKVRTLPEPNIILNHKAKQVLKPHPEFDL